MLPNDILYREKMGFAVPLASWFRGPLRDRLNETLLGDTMLQTGLFDREFLRRMLRQHQQGVRDYSPSIWTMLMFEGFVRRTLAD